MANPILSHLPNNKGKGNNNIVSKFFEFKNNFTGDPQQKINDMLNSGQVSQKDVDEATRLANMVKMMCGKK